MTFFPGTSLPSTAVVSDLRVRLAVQERFAGKRLSDAERVDLFMQEETLTEMMLLDLATAAASRYTVFSLPSSKPVEGKNGADWLWQFRGSLGGKTSLLVQAKRLLAKPITHRYAVDQEAGDAVKNVEGVAKLRQRDLLLKTGTQLGAYAGYIFYNPENLASAYTLGCSYQSTLGPLGGIGLADAASVDELVTSGQAPRGESGVLAGAAWPLSCALLCWSHARPRGFERPLDELVAKGLNASGFRRLRPQGDEAQGGDLRGILDRLSAVSTVEELDSEVRSTAEELLGAAGVRGVVLCREAQDAGQHFPQG